MADWPEMSPQSDMTNGTEFIYGNNYYSILGKGTTLGGCPQLVK